MVKVTQNLFITISLTQTLLGLHGSEAAIAVESSQAEFNYRPGKGFFQIGMIFKLSLGSTYPNTVHCTLVNSMMTVVEFYSVSIKIQ